MIRNDVDFSDAARTKQHLYRNNHIKLKHLRKEVEYIYWNTTLMNEETMSALPNAFRYQNQMEALYSCTDYQKVNNVTRIDWYG